MILLKWQKYVCALVCVCSRDTKAPSDNIEKPLRGRQYRSSETVRMLITHIWLNDKNVCIYPTNVDVQLCGHCHLPLSPVDESMFVLLLMSVCLRGDYKSPQMHAIFIAYRMVKTDIWLADTNPFSICASYTTCSSTTVSVCHSWPCVRIYAMWRESSLYRMWCN